MTGNDMENRLIDFAVVSIEIARRLPKVGAGIQLSHQLIRSGTSCALHYGDVQHAESKRDFPRVSKLVIKELNESRLCLKIIDRADLFRDKEELGFAISETKALILIFSEQVNPIEELPGNSQGNASKQ